MAIQLVGTTYQAYVLGDSNQAGTETSTYLYYGTISTAWTTLTAGWTAIQSSPALTLWKGVAVGMLPPPTPSNTPTSTITASYSFGASHYPTSSPSATASFTAPPFPADGNNLYVVRIGSGNEVLNNYAALPVVSSSCIIAISLLR